jgi:hypothetical protein
LDDREVMYVLRTAAGSNILHMLSLLRRWLAMEPASSAEVCGRCHRAIHDAWSSSSHAQAMVSPLFQDVLQLAEGDFGLKARRVCLGCHAPLALQTGDIGLVKKTSWEGVTCDYCHSLRSVSLEGLNPTVTLTTALVKSGPLKQTSSPAHGTVYSAVHTTSLVCAPCHEYKNVLGFPVLTTYSEWRNSSYAKEGKQCQSCHMNRTVGDVVDPRIQRSSVARINLHQMPGSHSTAQLTKAVKAQLSASREGDRLKVVVTVANQSAGHFLPTGSPLRQLLLEVKAENSQGESLRQERTYARAIADTHGTPILREHFAFIKAAKVLSDTRLAPGESRAETFWFPVAPGGPVRVKATFWYYYSPLARTESQQRITFLTLNRIVQ